MGMMSSGSWAAYREALPPEMLGEPDGDDHEPDPGPPTWWMVWWLRAATFVDPDTGAMARGKARTGRYFARDRHADPEGAARRWAAAMLRRHHDVHFVTGWDDGVSVEHRVDGPPVQAANVATTEPSS